jgi:hypothetical protein
MWTPRTLFGLLVVLTLLLSGCGSPTPTATPTATRTPTVEATATPFPTPSPTFTPTPEPEPETAEATPFPPDVNPLTGEQVNDPEMLEHAPLAVKISNSPEVRPQAGLNSADLIFEHFAEGGITRFTAVFYGTYPERAGSVRSGRLIDLEIPAMYDALFAFSGMSGGVKQRFRASDLFPNQVASPDFGQGQPYFYRIPEEGKAFEHTLYADLEALREYAADHGIDARPEYPLHMHFSETPPASAVDVDYFDIIYLANVCTAEWTYDTASERWMRETAGAVHRDALTGEQVSAANVIVVFANHLETDILEDIWGGGHMSIEVQIWGSGPVLIFRDGKMIQGWWRREARDQMLTFWDANDNPIPLKPGNSWFQMVPLDTPSEEVEGGYVFSPEHNF